MRKRRRRNAVPATKSAPATGQGAEKHPLDRYHEERVLLTIAQRRKIEQAIEREAARLIPVADLRHGLTSTIVECRELVQRFPTAVGVALGAEAERLADDMARDLLDALAATPERVLDA